MSTSLMLVGIMLHCSFADDVHPSVKEIVGKYAANMNNFASYKCRFILRDGTGTVDKMTYAVKYSDVSTCECFYVIDGDKEAYEQNGKGKLGPAKPMGSSNPTLGVQILEGIAFEKVIQNNGTYGTWNSIFKQLSLHDEPKGIGQECRILFNLGLGHKRRYDPVYKISNAHFAIDYLGSATKLGVPCEGIRFTYAPDRDIEELWFSINEGYLPIFREHHHDGNFISRLVITSRKEVKPGYWYPLVVTDYDPVSVKPRIQQWEHIDIEVPYRATKDDLSITLPAGTVIQNSDNGQFFKLRQDERISESDFPELYEKIARIYALEQKEAPFDTAIEHKGDKSSFWFWLCGGLGILLVGFGGFRWWRSRRAA